MARKMPLYRKQVWGTVHAYLKSLNAEFKRNGTIEGKALVTGDDTASALRALSRVTAVAERRANVVVKETASKGAGRKAKKAGKAKNGRKPRASRKSFDELPNAS